MPLSWNLEYSGEMQHLYRTDRTQKQHSHWLPEYQQLFSADLSIQLVEEEVRTLGELHQTIYRQTHEDLNISQQSQLSHFRLLLACDGDQQQNQGDISDNTLIQLKDSRLIRI